MLPGNFKKNEENKQYQGQTVSVLSEPSAPARFLLHVQRIWKKKYDWFHSHEATRGWNGWKRKNVDVENFAFLLHLTRAVHWWTPEGTSWIRLAMKKKNNSISCKPSMKTGCKWVSSRRGSLAFSQFRISSWDEECVDLSEFVYAWFLHSWRRGGERNGGSVAPLLTKGCHCKATNKSDSFADLRVSKKNITCCSCGSSRCQQ